MRLVGTFEKRDQAQIFYDYLELQGFESDLREDRDTGELRWAVWVLDNEHLPDAKEALKAFREDPNASAFQGLKKKAEKRRSEREDLKEREQEQLQKQIQNSRQIREFGEIPLGQVTIALMALSLVVAILSKLGSERTFLNYLFITKMKTIGLYVQWRKGLPEMTQHYEMWRLFTPMFIHFGFFHFLFNMWWLKDLGSMIEKRQSSFFLIGLVLFLSGTSNLAQYYGSSPNFGGMSGVVYGLFGYIWIRGLRDPRSGYHIDHTVVFLMIAWFVICFTGAVGPIANIAHTVGLVAGALWGFVLAQIARSKQTT